MRDARDACRPADGLPLTHDAIMQRIGCTTPALQDHLEQCGVMGDTLAPRATAEVHPANLRHTLELDRLVRQPYFDHPQSHTRASDRVTPPLNPQRQLVRARLSSARRRHLGRSAATSRSHAHTFRCTWCRRGCRAHRQPSSLESRGSSGKRMHGCCWLAWCSSVVDTRPPCVCVCVCVCV